MLKICPDPLDVQDTQFKLHCRLTVFSNKDVETFNVPHNLISAASRYGLVFVGTNSPNLQVMQINCLENLTPKDKDVAEYPRRTVPLPSRPKHLSVNCDCTVLAVVTEKDRCPNVIFYDVLSFYKQMISVIKEVRLSASPGTSVNEIAWNPSLPAVFTACKSDGTLGVYEIKGGSVDINELPPAAGTTCFSWSPKGKQIAVGSQNGKITQYKPDLKAVKVISGPPLEGPHSLISLQWVSNYQFIGIYQPSNNEDQAKLIVVDAPKSGDTSYTNYDDVCYSSGGRMPQFFMNILMNWNMLMVASSNSTEVAVLGQTSPDSWTQLIISDSARAELPLSSDRQETFPIGLTLDISSTKPYPWGESTIPPCPYLMVLSHQGVLCVFDVVNLKNVPNLCAPPDTVTDTSGLVYFVKPKVDPAPRQSAFVTPQAPPISVPVVTTVQPFFGAPSTAVPAKPQQSLFGGQVTITPSKPKPQVAPAFSTAQADTQTSVSKPDSEKYSSILASLNTTVQAPSASKPILISVQTKTAEPKQVAEVSRSDTEALLGKMIREECVWLESELKTLLRKGRTVDVRVGTDEDKEMLVESITGLQEFIKEIVDISSGANAEVHTLKQNLILSWAWYEEARSRFNTSKDETMNLLLKAQPLDSATDKRYADIKRLIYYIDSQVSQVNKTMDEQWDRFQDYVKKTNRVQMPTMEAIFQAMVRQNAVLQKQGYIMADIATRLKFKGQQLQGPALWVSRETSRIEDDLKNLEITPDDTYHKSFEKVLNRSKQFTQTKANKLRKLLKNREVVHVAASKPQTSFSTSLFSPTKNISQSILGAKMSPVKPVSNQTPVSKETGSFVSLSKSASAFSNFPSAFASTSQKPVTIAQSSPLPKFASTHKPASNLFGTSASMPQIPIGSQITVTVKSSASATPLEGPTPFSNMPKTTSEPTTVTTIFGAPGSLFATKSATTTAISSTTSAAATKSTSAFSFNVPSSTAGLPVFNFTSLKASTSAVAPAISLSASASTSSATITSSIGSSATTSSTLLFGTSPGALVFGKTVISTVSTPAATTKALPLFSTATALSKPSLVGVPTSASVSTSEASQSSGLVSTVSQSSMFSPKTTAETAKPLFVTSPVTAGQQTSFFGGSAVETSMFGSGSATTTSVFAPATTNSTTKPVVQSNTTTTTTTSSLLFGQLSAGLDTTAASIFGEAAVSSSTPTIPSTGTASAQDTTIAQLIFGQSTPIQSTLGQTAASSTTSSVTTASSVFGQSATTVASIFGQSTTLSTTSAQSVFEPTAVSSTASSTSVFAQGTTAGPLYSSSVFGQSTGSSATSGQSAQPLVPATATFGQSTPASISGEATSSTTAPVFGQITTSAPIVFGSSTTKATSIYGQATTTTASVFGLSTEPSSTTEPIFGTSTTPTSISSAPSIFGSSTTTAPSIFGQATTTTTSIFGQSTEPSSTTEPFFGTSTTATSIFGQSAGSTTMAAPAFGPSTTTTSIFGQSTMTAPVFGPSTTATSIFGQGTGSGITTAPLFGPATTTAASIFGQSAVSSTSSAPSIFGQSTTTSTSTSVFGSAATASPFGFVSGNTASPFSQTGSIFGTPTTTTSGFGAAPSTNIFGAAATVSSSGSIFGSGAASSFSFAQPAAAGSPEDGKTFSFGGLNVGASPTKAGSIFGGGGSAAFGSPVQTANPFGRSAEQKPSFGGGSPSIFGSPSSTNASIFASNPQPGGFGTSSAAFGSAPAFGQQSAFGQAQGGFFETTQQPGPFSGGGGGVGQTGFGSTGGFQQKPTAFGGAPVFGGGSPAPAFGGNPTFGGSPAFGAAPAFGSPGKVFGSTTPTATFGSASSGSPGFGNLATQNTIGFGNLAQQAVTPPASQPFSGNASFSSWR